MNHILDSDTKLAEKITQIKKTMKRTQTLEANYHTRYRNNLAECRQKQQDNLNRPQKHKELNKYFYQYMKKDQNLPNKSIQSSNSSGKLLPDSLSFHKSQYTYRNNFRGRSPVRPNSNNYSQNQYSRSNNRKNQYRNNYSRSNSNRSNYSNYIRDRFFSNSRNRYYSNDRSRNSSNNRN